MIFLVRSSLQDYALNETTSVFVSSVFTLPQLAHASPVSYGCKNMCKEHSPTFTELISSIACSWRRFLLYLSSAATSRSSTTVATHRMCAYAFPRRTDCLQRSIYLFGPCYAYPCGWSLSPLAPETASSLPGVSSPRRKIGCSLSSSRISPVCAAPYLRMVNAPFRSLLVFFYTLEYWYNDVLAGV